MNLNHLDLKSMKKKRYKMPENEKVDLAMISGVMTK